MTMRVKSRVLTVRSHNLDARPSEKLNAVVRGVSRYFGTHFSTCKTQLCDMDQWLRMRLNQKSRMANVGSGSGSGIFDDVAVCSFVII